MSNTEHPSSASSRISSFLRSPKFAALCGILGPIIGFISIGIAVAISAAWFNWFTNALSDLGHPLRLGGMTGTPGINPAAPIFNGGLLLAGIVSLIFAIYLIWFHLKARNILCLIGSIFLFLAMANLAGVGVFHEMFILPHIITAFGFFITISIAPFFYGVGKLLDPENRLMGIFIIVVGVVMTISFWGSLYLPTPWTGAAIPEMLIAIIGYIWTLPIAFQVYQS
jgi:hypothetical membrane protein